MDPTPYDAEHARSWHSTMTSPEGSPEHWNDPEVLREEIIACDQEIAVMHERAERYERDDFRRPGFELAHDKAVGIRSALIERLAAHTAQAIGGQEDHRLVQPGESGRAAAPGQELR